MKEKRRKLRMMKASCKLLLKREKENRKTKNLLFLRIFSRERLKTLLKRTMISIIQQRSQRQRMVENEILYLDLSLLIKHFYMIKFKCNPNSKNRKISIFSLT
jgi:hypothetical protein